VYQCKSGSHVFIVTYGRSGSTLLQRVLQTIPGFFIRGENNHTLYPMYLAYRRAHEARYRHGTKEHHSMDPWYGADAIDPQVFARGLAELFMKDIIQPPADARVVGFKEIRFHEAGDELFEPYLDFIFDNFADSKFIFNMRGWEAISKSSWWAKMDSERVRSIIEGADTLYQNYAAKHPERCCIMSYENYDQNPDAYEPLFQFLGETFDRDLVADIISRRLKHAEVVMDGSLESHRQLTP